MVSLASDIFTYLTKNKHYLDKCSKVVEHLSTIMYATNFVEKVCGIKSLLVMKTDPYITILVIHYWRSQNIHMPLKVAYCLTYVRELKDKSFPEM